ncbi:MAG: helix-turn-helix domain-containing protein [Clostridia bacterium]|nr:helix-turn-helix domain-containing protein [Clostridia bacterium]
MKTKLAENIKLLRKERKMTQEQLAEAMGVTVGAVYKWESNQSTPEVGTIMELANLFDTSTDVLLGYEWVSSNAGAALERIVSLTHEEKYEEASTEAEKALKKYPNHFGIVYRSALVYLLRSESVRDRKLYSRAVSLLDHACELLSQNKDDTISEISIRTLIAKAHLLSGDPKGALDVLKRHNACGVNNATIGMVLADYLHDADEAEKYLGRAFQAYIDDINSIVVGYANVFFQRKDYDAAIDCFFWLRTVLRGIQPRTELTWFDKYDCVLLESIAECHCFKGQFDTAKLYLKEAVERAVQYDSASQGEVNAMEFFTKLRIEQQPTYDLYGKTAMDCLQRRMQPDDEGVPQLWQLWLDVKKEVFPDETV